MRILRDWFVLRHMHICVVVCALSGAVWRTDSCAAPATAFGNPAALARHLHEIDVNATLYESYFAWRRGGAAGYASSPLAARAALARMDAAPAYNVTQRAGIGCELCRRVHHVRAGCALADYNPDP